MKWYKKQLEQLEKTKSESTKENKPKKTSGHSFDPKKLRAVKSNFRNPVGESKLQRDKTDVH